MPDGQLEVVNAIEVTEDDPKHDLSKGDKVYQLSNGEFIVTRRIESMPPVDMVGLHPAHPDAVKISAELAAIERYQARVSDA